MSERKVHVVWECIHCHHVNRWKWGYWDARNEQEIDIMECDKCDGKTRNVVLKSFGHRLFAGRAVNDRFTRAV